MIKINADKCIGCSECVRVCAGLVLSMQDKLPKYAGRGCMACGHCVSTCPSGAIELDLTAAIGLEPDNELEKCILGRRSIRHYKPDTPDRAIIEDALQKAQWSPNSKNQQKRGWSVVLGKDQVERLLADAIELSRANGKNRGQVRLYDSGVNLVTCNAPCLIFSWIDESAINHELDCAIATSTAELMLGAKGLGTCWGGFANRMFSASPEILALSGIPEGARLCCSLMVGYPDEHYSDRPDRPSATINWRD